MLRTNAAATGSTALRALTGTVIGFAIGAALLLLIGTYPTALWIALPFAVLVAWYSPGTAPFAVGQAAFTITVLVIFNLLVPAGWKVGLLRIEDVGIGCAVSIIVGILFWPRGAGGIVGAPTCPTRSSAAPGTWSRRWTGRWASGRTRRTRPLPRSWLAFGRTRRCAPTWSSRAPSGMAKHDPGRSLVMGSTRLRLTAYSVASLLPPTRTSPRPAPDPPGRRQGRGPSPGTPAHPPRSAFQHLAKELAPVDDQVAGQLAGTAKGEVTPARLPELTGPDLPVGVACAGETTPAYDPDLLWVGEYLYHLDPHARAVSSLLPRSPRSASAPGGASAPLTAPP